MIVETGINNPPKVVHQCREHFPGIVSGLSCIHLPEIFKSGLWSHILRCDLPARFDTAGEHLATVFAYLLVDQLV